MKMHLRGGKKDILANKYTFSKSSPPASFFGKFVPEVYCSIQRLKCCSSEQEQESLE